MNALYLIPDPERLPESCALAREYGARFEYNDFFDPLLLDDPARRDERIARYLALDRDRREDTLHGAFRDVVVHSDDPQIRAVSERRVLQSLEIAAALGLRGAVFHTGTLPLPPGGRYGELWLSRNAAFWRRAAAAFPDLEILIENMFDPRCDLPLALAGELSDLPRFGVCLDCAHAAVFGRGEADPAGWIERLGPRIRHLHLNDHDGLDDLHAPVGSGVSDWVSIDRAVRALPGAPSVLVEVSSLEGQRASLQYMKRRHIYPFD